MFLLCWRGHCGRWNWGDAASPNSGHAARAGLKRITLVGVSWLSLDCTQICLQRWDVIDQDLICCRFSLSSSFRLSLLSPYSRQPSHVKTCPLHTHSPFSATCGLCVLDVYKTSGRRHLQDMTHINVCVWFMTGPEISALYTSTHLCTFANTHTLFCFTCSVDRIEHKQAKSNIAVHTLSLEAEAEMALRSSCLRWVMVVLVQVSHNVLGLHFNDPHF